MIYSKSCLSRLTLATHWALTLQAAAVVVVVIAAAVLAATAVAPCRLVGAATVCKVLRLWFRPRDRCHQLRRAQADVLAPKPCPSYKAHRRLSSVPVAEAPLVDYSTGSGGSGSGSSTTSSCRSVLVAKRIQGSPCMCSAIPSC